MPINKYSPEGCISGNFGMMEGNIARRGPDKITLHQQEEFYVIYRPGYGFRTVTGAWMNNVFFAYRHPTLERAIEVKDRLMPPLRGESSIMKARALVEMESCN